MGICSGGLTCKCFFYCFVIFLTNKLSNCYNESITFPHTRDNVTSANIQLVYSKIRNTTPSFSHVILSVQETSLEMPVPGGTFTYQYTVTNIDNQARNYTISADVDNYILYAWISEPNFTLHRSQSKNGLITINVDRRARPGLERTVKFKVTDDKDRSQQITRFIVIREEPFINDVNPPEIIILNFLTACKEDVKKDILCGVGNWTVLFIAQDRDSGVSIIDVDDHSISSVWTEDYSQGQVIRPINGKVSTDCCQKRTVIIVTDNNGNTIRIPVYLPDTSPSSTSTSETQASHSVMVPSVIITVFSCCLLLVIICTLAVQNWSKLPCNKTKDDNISILMQQREN